MAPGMKKDIQEIPWEEEKMRDTPIAKYEGTGSL